MSRGREGERRELIERGEEIEREERRGLIERREEREEGFNSKSAKGGREETILSGAGKELNLRRSGESEKRKKREESIQNE